MAKYRREFRRVHKSLWVALALLLVFSFLLQNVTGTAYYSLTVDSQATVSSPEVILQNGTAGTSTIYTNNTSAKVSVTAPTTNNTEDYVDLLSNVDNSADIGTHSNFTAQKYGPDLINDTLTEENTGIISIDLYVNADDESRTDWTRVGTNPYLDAIDYNTSYVSALGLDLTVGDFNFTDSGLSTQIVESTFVQLYAKQSLPGKSLSVSIWDGNTWSSLGLETTPTSWGWMNWTTTTVLDTWAKIDTAKMRISTNSSVGTYEVDCGRLKVDYHIPTISIDLYVNADDESRTDWTRVGTNPYLDAIDYNSSYVYTSGNNLVVGDFNFTDSGKSSEIVDSVVVQLYVKQSVSGRSLEVFVWDGSTWSSLGLETTPTSWGWMNWTVTTLLDTWTKIDGARMYIQTASSTGVFEVDCARLKIEYTAKYELDLEVQWTSVDFDEPGEELCIYGGTMGSENVTVDVWNGSAWENLFTDLSSGWNNISISTYLTSSDFTIRFRGGNETDDDTTQDSWNIDATLLHTWTYAETTYDYVLRANNTVTNSWEVRLKKYSNSSIGRLQNCTIYFHNSTDGASSQIVIENGLFINQTGPWYDLGNSETIYIALTVEANSTGTSYVRTYLEILTPSTTTYAQYTITFEIS